MQSRIKSVTETIRYDLEKANFTIKTLNEGRALILQKDPAVTAVADLTAPDLADTIVEYHHHLLKGDLEKKKAILKRMADALQPKRAKLKSISKKITEDFFYMVNKSKR